MKSIQTLCLGAMLLAPMLTHAAGFDCAKASTPVEKAICASPKVSAIDGALGDAFKAALQKHPEKADALRLDQRHWLADRDAAVWAALRDNPYKLLSPTVGQYRERIDFLKGLDTPAPKPLDLIQAALPKVSGVSYELLEALARQGVPIEVATDGSLEKPGAFPYEPDKAVKDALDNKDETSNYRVLAGSPVSSVYSLGGTAHCYSETPFRIEGKKAIAVEAPGAWSDDCMSSHELAKIGDDYAALVLGYPTPDEVSIQAARWEGKAFGPDHLLVARFDHSLSPQGSGCAPKQIPCDDFATAAMAYVARYDRSPIPATLARVLKGADKAAYDAALAAATEPGGMAAKDAGTYPSLPDFGGDIAGNAMADYSSDAEFFPLSFRGETLLGYIDHGHVGWRVNDDWLVSAWRLKGGKLEAVASVYVEVKRGGFLLSSIVPAPPPESH